MGAPKALLPDANGLPFVLRICRTLSEAGLAEVVIVAGEQHPRIDAALQASEWRGLARLVRNPHPEHGQLSSLQTGMAAAVSEKTQALLVTLVDVPLVAPGTVRAVLDAWAARRSAVVRPAVGGRHGHPVIFDARLFGELRAAPLGEGAKHVIRRHAAAVEDVPVLDEGCLTDVDTPADYERVIGGEWAGRARPTAKPCGSDRRA
jgi:molybdenum cofactor cytidylyltransferase